MELIQKHEGYRRFPYTDSRGFLTVGWGHNLSANSLAPQVLAAIDAALETQYQIDKNAAEVELKSSVPFVTSLDSARYQVLVDMAYNLGVPKLLQFHLFLQALQTGQWLEAKAQMLNSAWATEVGPRATEDAQIIESGILPPDVSTP